MNIKVIGSDDMIKKLNPMLESNGHRIVKDASSDYILVESGYPLEDGAINIVFPTLDFQKALDLLYMSSEFTGPINTIIGFSNNRYSIIALDSIIKIGVQGKELLSLSDKGSFLLKKPLYYYEQLLNQSGFLRINKSELVNMNQVLEIIPWFNGRFVLKMTDNSQLEVSKTYAKKLRSILDL